MPEPYGQTSSFPSRLCQPANEKQTVILKCEAACHYMVTSHFTPLNHGSYGIEPHFGLYAGMHTDVPWWMESHPATMPSWLTCFC